MNIDKIISKDSILFFDLDGTLIYTDYANFNSYKDALKKIKNIDLVFDPQERFDRNSLINYYPNLNEFELNEIIRQKELNYVENLDLTIINTLLLKILDKYSDSHVTVLVTNCRKNRANITLKYHNLANKFSHCFFRQLEVNKFKNAIQQLNIPTTNIIVFENDQQEIENALLAGIPKKNIIKI